jgi:hypothetical protein
MEGFNKGVIVDEAGFFLGAVKWRKGTPAPDLNGPRKEGANAPRLRLLTEPEAIDDPIPNGKWDAKRKEWLSPPTKLYVVTVRRDLPRYGAYAGFQMVWPDRLPDLPDWQRFVEEPAPEWRRSKPLWDFEEEEWIFPVEVIQYEEDGETCKDVILKPRAEPGDEVGPVMVEDEIGNKRRLKAGMRRSGGEPPRYPEVPVRFLRQALQERNLLQPFVRFLRDKGFDNEDFEALETVSLNNRILREFVQAQGFTMRQAYNALQRDAEEKQKQERAKRRELARESGRGNGNA